MQVASTNDERWQWRKVKQKNDRRDALKTAQLSARNELELVHVPQSEMRQWRALIAYRHHLVQRRTKIKNHIRELLLREGQILPRHRSAWTQDGLAALEGKPSPNHLPEGEGHREIILTCFRQLFNCPREPWVSLIISAEPRSGDRELLQGALIILVSIAPPGLDTFSLVDPRLAKPRSWA
jgi:hypothetical protein